MIIRLKEMLRKEYKPHSANSMLAAVNKFLKFSGKEECRVRSLKLQARPFMSEEKNLSRKEYYRLLYAAGKDSRLQLIIESICGTGIRVSELKYFTKEGVERGELEISCKGKIRVIIIPKKLQKNFYEKWTKFEKSWGFVMDFMCIRCYNDHREWLMHSGNTT